ncbi:MAG: hypothetical protein A7316_09715 [Candidatus Altiarchaeales archaeon WOR_SM1_86-2]|nr:MAG: hypothetical protein A7316_09715 [Candidatus Altiarchaeales archaeon WOR_SM1_86-2]
MPGGFNRLSLRILIVSGIEGAPFIYRCLNLKELISYFGNHRVTCKYVRELVPSIDAKEYEIIILNRPFKSPKIMELINLCKEKDSTLVYSTDDLVTDHDVENYLRLDKYMSISELAQFHEGVDWNRDLIKSMDAVIVSTDYLKSQLIGFNKKVYVLENALNEKQLKKAEGLRPEAIEKRSNRDEIILGYFSGWPHDHDYDFNVIADPLFKIIDKYEYIKLRIVGYLEVDESFNALGNKIERMDFVPFEVFPKYISEVDINLAPLEPNPHKLSKSAVKFLEAALFNVPTIASYLEPYKGVITHLEDGVLCSDSEEWLRNLQLLVEDTSLRHKIGERAYSKVMSEHTTIVRSTKLGEIMNDIINGKTSESIDPEKIKIPSKKGHNKDTLLDPRQNLSNKYIKGNGIEIGALHNPLPVDNKRAKVRYVDCRPIETLREHYLELKQNSFVSSDIIASAEDLSVISDSSLDFLIANHLLEHCANPIKALKEFHRVVKKYNGIVYLSLPNTQSEGSFDKGREITTIEHLINDYFAKDSERHLLDFIHFWEWVIYAGKRCTFEAALMNAKKLYDMEFSIHYHVFVEENFLALLGFMRENLNIRFEIVEKHTDEYEFIFILKPIY